MSHDDYRAQYEAAEAHRREGDHEEAGTTFSLAAYELLGESGLADREGMLTAVATLTEAAICYRIGGYETRCRVRCRQGETVVDEIDELLFTAEPFHGLAHELRGDFRLVCGSDGHRKHHRRARAVYADYETDSDQWSTTTEFEISLSPFLKAADAVDHQYDHYQPLDELSLLSRLFEKKYHFEEILAEIAGSDVWSWSG